ncbi:hypothetical protein GCM10009555_072620 [Acrocarpospora macrocephala]|uniref:Uncharacterized protein n=1 Tax=Acrocarpospora macrocephala TaxID=150177 RepID=A0A5M3WN30_9ACTN|nr:hypothetical protein Amac_021870 [Acrocarpospora macrocephala]
MAAWLGGIAARASGLLAHIVVAKAHTDQLVDRPAGTLVHHDPREGRLARRPLDVREGRFPAGQRVQITRAVQQPAAVAVHAEVGLRPPGRLAVQVDTFQACHERPIAVGVVAFTRKTRAM